MGMFIQNIQRQSKYVVMNPPMGGPTRGPMSAGIVSQARASTSCDFETVRRIMMRPTGTIMAPPTPCKARAAMSQPRDCENPQAMEPSMNTARAARNTCFAPNRSANQPLMGMKMVRLKR